MASRNFTVPGYAVGKAFEPLASDFWDCLKTYNTTGIQADPDVAGIEVIIGFVGTAWIVVLILVFYSIASYDPTINYFSENLEEKLVRPNPVDITFYRVIACLLSPLDAAEERYEMVRNFRAKIRSPRSHDVFFEVVMALSDAQIVTGLAILISGYCAALRGMSGYHWRMLVRVAWFSTITHLAALSFLRTHLHRNKLKRAIRLILMGCLAIMLIFATLVTADSAFQNNLPAICFLNIPKSHTALKNLDVVASVLMLMYNIVLREFKLHRAFSEGIPRKIRRLLIRLTEPVTRTILRNVTKPTSNKRMRGLKRATYAMLFQPLIASLVVTRTYYFVYTSMTAEIYWLLVSAFWGTLSLLELRNGINPPGENNWTLGQIVPCALFLAPVLTLADTIAKTWNGPPSVQSIAHSGEIFLFMSILVFRFESWVSEPGPRINGKEPQIPTPIRR
ncbi:hypothetical protein V8F06_014479 [Rhypophila decipiens]